MAKLFLYLGRRDKKGMQLLSVFNAPKEIRPTRVQNIKDLKLPHDLEQEIAQTVHDERMLHELWMESAENFAGLKESLKKRGYKNLPIQQAPLHVPLPKPRESGVTLDTRLKPRKTMLRRGSDQARRT